MTVKIDQIADAILSAPGDLVRVTEAVSTTVTINSNTWTAFLPQSSTSNFHTKLNAKYRVDLDFQYLAQVGLGTFEFKAIIDEGTSDEQTIGETADWHIRTGNAADDNVYVQAHFVTTVNLTSGNHTLVVYGRRRIESSGGSIQIVQSSVEGNPRSPSITFHAVTGSGAGGEIGESYTMDDSDSFTSLGTSWLAVNDGVQDVSVSVTVSGTSDVVHIGGCVNWYCTSAMNFNIGIGIGSDDPISPNYCQIDGQSASPGNEESWTPNLRITGLDAGTYTFKLMVRRVLDTAGNLTIVSTSDRAYSHIHATVYRGGLVPIQQDGYDVVGQPRALNFIGAGVYEVTDAYGIANIELNQAITTIGTFQEIFRQEATGGATLSSASWVDVPNLSEQTFEIVGGGLYELMVSPTLMGGTVLDQFEARYQLIIDEGNYNGFAEQTVGVDDEEWSIRVRRGEDEGYLDDHRTTIHTSVTLAAGTHKIKFQYKKVSTNAPRVRATSPFVIHAKMVAGSGAGGVVLTEDELTSPYTVDTGPQTFPALPTDTVSGLSLALDCVIGETIRLSCIGTTVHLGSPGTLWLNFAVDGTIIHTAPAWSESSNTGYRLSVAFTEDFVATASSHTITLLCANDNTQTFDLETGLKITAMQYRGGLVPVRDDSVTVIDKPAAFDFVGPNVQVTNVGGTAKVTYNGVAEGVIRTTATKTDEQDISASIWTEISDLTLDVDTIEGEVVQVSAIVNLFKTSSGGTPRLAYRVDSDPRVVFMLDYQDQNLWQAFTPTVSIGGLSAGSHQINFDIYIGGGTGTVDDLAGSINSSSLALQYRGGYVQPENVPELTYNNTGSLYASPKAGAASRLWIVMNDGVRYYADGAQALDMTTSGLGGIEASESETTSTWYFVYAVPSNTTGIFDIIASPNNPNAGPTDYSVWKYLGCFYNNSNGDIRKFAYTGAWHRTDNESTDIEVLNTTSPTLGAWTALTTTVAVPAGMYNVLEIDGWALGATGDYTMVCVEPANPSWTPTDSESNAARALLFTQQMTVNRNVRTLSTTDNIEYYVLNRGGSVPLFSQLVIRVTGFKDKYLANSQDSQTQSNYVPDSKLPKLEWRDATTVDVSSMPGESSTVSITLQDGKRRTFSGTLQWDPSTGVADGGLDSGTEATETWYYLYLVPRSGEDDFLHVRGSISTPETGPTGYSEYRYVGAVYNDSSSNLVRFYQSGSRFNYAQLTEPASIAALTKTAFVDPADAYDISDVVPATASVGFFDFKVIRDTSAPGYNILGELFVDGYIDETSTHGTESTQRLAFVISGDDTNDAGIISTEIPLPTTPKAVGYRVYCDTASPTIAPLDHQLDVVGWVDGYLGFVGSDSSIGGGGSGTLNQAYHEGRIITADEGPVEVDANGDNALELDGYITLSDISDPSALEDRGLVYTKSDSGDSELFYMDDSGRITQITKDGVINAAELGAHASSHISSGSDEIDGDQLDIDWDPINYVPSTAPTEVASVDHLTAHLYGIDGYLAILGNDVETHLVDYTNPHEVTLDQAYDGSGGGAGKTITVDSGPVNLNAVNDEALRVDGYVGFSEISDPVALLNKGLLFVKDADGYSELFYMDNYGTLTQITSDGYLNVEYAREASDELSSTGAETSLSLSEEPLVHPTTDSGFALDVFLNGVRMKYVTVLGSDPTEWTYSSSLNRIEFLASGENDWYLARYTTVAGVAVSGGGGSIESPLTTKGDIWTYDTDDARLPIGNDGQILSVDLGESTSLKWIDASADSDLIDGYLPLPEKASNPTQLDNYGLVYTKQDDEYGTTDLFYMDNSGQVTQLTQDGYLATYNSLRGLSLYEVSELPPIPSGKLGIFAKTVSGRTELFVKDDSDSETQITDNGQVSSGTDNDAIHDNVASEISVVTRKITPISEDLLLIEDSADGYNKKKVQIGDLPGGSGTDDDAIHDNVASEISAISEKTTPVDADLLIIEDSEDSNNKKKLQVGNLPSGTLALGGTAAETVDMIKATPTTTPSYGSAAWVDIESGVLDGTFSVDTEGEYDIYVRPSCYPASNWVRAYLGLILDEGEANEQTLRPTDEAGMITLSNGGRAHGTLYLGSITLEAGSHTAELQWYRVDGDGNIVTNTYSPWHVWCEFKPAALPAAVSAPGDAIILTDGQPASTITLNDSTYTLVAPETGGFSFTPLVTGTYVVRFSLSTLNPSGSTATGLFKLVFDEGESYEQEVGDTEDWQVRCTANSNWAYPTFETTVTLDRGGIHTVKVYGICSEGDGLRISADNKSQAPVISMVAVTGSGAGGIVYGREILASTQDDWDTSNTYTDIPTMSGVTFDVAQDEQVLILVNGSIGGNGGQAGVYTQITIDGTVIADDRSFHYETITYGGAVTIALVSDELDVGSHTVKVQMKRSQTFDVYAGFSIEVVQYRGGLVPITDGTTTVDKPARITYENAELTDSGGDVTITLPRAVTALGDAVTLSEGQPSSTITIATSPTYTQVSPESGVYNFNALATADYRVFLSVPLLYPGGAGAASAQFKIVFDEGESYEQTIGDDASWQGRADSNAYFNSPTFPGKVSLTAGSHTAKVYGTCVSGSGMRIAATGTAVTGAISIALDSVTGSGVGGTLVDTKELTSTFEADTSWDTISDGTNTFEITVDCAQDEVINIELAGFMQHSAAVTPFVRFTIDDVVVGPELGERIDATNHRTNISMSVRSDQLSAGSRTVKAQAKVFSGTVTVQEARFSVTRFRGGLVPIKSDGYAVQDKPVAINYVGPNLIATDSSGQVDISTELTPVTASSSGPVSLVDAYSGKVYTNEGATSEVEFILPTAVADLNYTFIIQDSDGIKVTAASGDTIRVAGSATPAAGNISASTVGNTVKLVAINATEWIAVYYVGTWTVSS